MAISMGDRLERYTLKRPDEVLEVAIALDGEPDQVIIFRGFSSSLMRPTAFDPDVPMIPGHAQILSVNRLQGPYTPQSPRYIERGLNLDAVEALLTQVGV